MLHRLRASCGVDPSCSGRSLLRAQERQKFTISNTTFEINASRNKSETTTPTQVNHIGLSSSRHISDDEFTILVPFHGRLQQRWINSQNIGNTFKHF